MKCPKCGAEIGNLSYCSNCNFNIDIYKKTRSISARLYNKGLEQANSKDFSSAIETLNKSVEFNKMNYLARNVLGLVYYEIGDIGRALKEWIISNSLVKEDNLAKTYIDSVQNNTKILEKLNSAIKMYNQALIYLNQKSEDMAVIQLKKALELNPNFLEANNLLALCYLSLKESDKAMVYIKKALEIDISNPKALKYHLELNEPIQRNIKIEKTKSAPVTAKYTQPTAIDEKNKSIFNPFTGFAIGVVVLSIIVFAFIIPAIKKDSTNQIKELTEQNQQLKQDLETKLAENSSTISQLQTENQSLSEQNQALSQQLQEKELIQKVFQASELYDNGNKEESASLLQSLASSTSSFPEETKILYDSLTATIYPDVARIYYNNGVNSYNRRNYDEARSLFEKSYTMIKDLNISDDALYYIARIDEANNNIDNAKKLYQRLMDDYPSSNWFYTARNRLNSLG